MSKPCCSRASMSCMTFSSKLLESSFGESSTSSSSSGTGASTFCWRFRGILMLSCLVFHRDWSKNDTRCTRWFLRKLHVISIIGFLKKELRRRCFSEWCKPSNRFRVLRNVRQRSRPTKTLSYIYAGDFRYRIWVCNTCASESGLMISKSAPPHQQY